MNIILLSGGSGKRLWPLSNEIRSKQFIKLFKNGDSRESMLERVYRQIKTVDQDADITIATSKTQVAAIHNQIGDEVSVCTEPVRKDTFPAIALACMYLYDVKKKNPDEPVIVCPIDPYVDNTYFETFKELEKLTDQSALVLMGIEPTYPSEKYGYIIPVSEDRVSAVREFREKPDQAAAEEFMSRGALWNSGVFAFRLSYLIEKAHELLNFKDYHDLAEHYDSCPKISFDYAVAEKEKSISVVRYQGSWKDVGTWNTMSEVMDGETIGDVTMDEQTTDTNVINELDIPVLVMGVHHMIVATSGDGILISDKERSGYMKPYVDQISTDVHYADKSWGTYQLIDADDNSRTIKVILKPDSQMSYHSHARRDEVWTVISGSGRAIVDGEEQRIKTGDVITMHAGSRHTVIADTELQMIEIQIGKDIDVHDKKKYRWKDDR